MAGNILEVTDANFDAEVLKSDVPVLVDFWAEWCGPCRMIAPLLDQLLAEYGAKGLKVVKVDVDASQATAMRFNVRSIPMLLFFRNGKPVDQIVGAVPKPHLAARIEKHLAQ